MKAPWFQEAFGAHYPLLYGHRDRDEARRCLDLLPLLAPLTTGSALLDLGCGDGRHLSALAGAGLPAVGLDLSPHLLRGARREGPARLPLVRGDMRCLPCRDECCGGVLSLFTAFGYFGPLPDNGGVVREVARVLAPGAHWFLDYFDCDAVRRELAGATPAQRFRELGPLAVGETRRLTPEGLQVEKHVELSPLPGRQQEALLWGVGPAGVRYTESVALFSVDQLAQLAAGHGLTLVASAGSYAGAPLGEGSRWILVFRKVGSPAAGGSGGAA